MYHKLITFLLSLTIAISILLDGYFVLFQTLVENRHSTATTSNSLSSSSSAKAVKNTTSQIYKDGTYIGKSTTTAWGDVQLKIKITNNKITQITILKYPNTHSHSVALNQRVLPIYRQEAIKSQSANIQQVSGATETWKGFTGSLQNALIQARKA